MKKRLVFLTIILSLSMAGCSQKEENIEPTEAVMETETEEPTEEVAVETETEETFLYPNIREKNGEYKESIIELLSTYKFFEGKSKEEIIVYLDSDDDLQYYLNDEDYEIVDKYVKACYKYYGNDAIAEEENKQTESNQSSSKNNSSSTASTSNNNSSSDVPPEDTASSGDTINVGGWELPAGSVDNGDGTWTTPDGFTVNVSSFNESYEEPIPSEPEPSEPVQSEPTHVAEDNGYSVGSTKTVYYRGRDITLTYQGNDVWIDNEGTTWHTYMNSDGHMHWSTGIY